MQCIADIVAKVIELREVNGTHAKLFDTCWGHVNLLLRRRFTHFLAQSVEVRSRGK